MAERNIGLEILEGVREIKEYKKGNLSLKTSRLSEPSPPRTIREKLHLSQIAFANLMVGQCQNFAGLGTGQENP